MFDNVKMREGKKMRNRKGMTQVRAAVFFLFPVFSVYGIPAEMPVFFCPFGRRV